MSQELCNSDSLINTGKQFSLYSYQNYGIQQNVTFINQDKNERILEHDHKIDKNSGNLNNLQLYMTKNNYVEVIVKQDAPFENPKCNIRSLYPETTVNTDTLEIKQATDEKSKESKGKKQKRAKHEENWKRNKIKSMRNSGQSYINWRNKKVAQRTLKSPCGDQCKIKCKSKFTEDQRQDIFNNYWALGDVDRQRDFIACFVCFMKKKRQRRLIRKNDETGELQSTVETLNTKKESRRNMTYIYNLPRDDQSVKVCKVFFLNTLSISHQVVKTVAAKYSILGKNFLLSDQRGKQCREKYPDTVKDAVRQHIMKFVIVENSPSKKKSGKKSMPSTMSSNNSELRSMEDLNRETKLQKKKRMRHEENWKRNRIKSMRNTGKSYINWRNKPVAERVLKSPCGDQCKLKCKRKFTENQRSQIFTDYWALGDVNRQRFFIARFVNFTKTKNQRRLANKLVAQGTEALKSKEESRRVFTYIYNLPLDAQVIRVCKVFFLNTLCISHQVVKTVAAKCALSGKCSIIADQRGKRKISMHQGKKLEGGNGRTSKITTRNYLPASITVSKMYSIYKKECEEKNEPLIVTPYIYKKIFNQQLNAKKFVIKKEPINNTSENQNLNKEIPKGDQHLHSECKPPDTSIKEQGHQEINLMNKKAYNNEFHHMNQDINKDGYLHQSHDVFIDQVYMGYNTAREIDIHSDVGVNQCRQETFWQHQYMPY